MELEETPFNGLCVIRPKIFKDERGLFFESFNENKMSFFKGINFVQENQSVSSKHVLRGLHFQKPPFAQGKLIRVVKGSVLDVVVDLRKNEETFGQHFSICLTQDDHAMLWVPKGFAHGFISLEDDTTFLYKCSEYYHPDSEVTLLWNDPLLAIDWGVSDPLISSKDRVGKLLKELPDYF